MTETTEQAKEQLLTPRFIVNIAKDLITFATLFVLVGLPLLNLAVFRPQEELTKRLERLEQAHEQTRSNLSSIDKNLAVLAESTKRTDEAIRTLLATKDKH
jgi:septal ring factor EnvC (AmiA/AmiB activator)